MVENPLVSIVMSTFNRADSVAETLRSIYKQNYQSIEVIVVDDGSTDDTSKVLSKLKEDFDFFWLKNSENIGLQKSLNHGVKRAKGKYIARIDDHDFWEANDKLSKQVAFLENHQEVGLLGTGYTISGKPTFNPTTDAAIRKQMLMRCPFCHVTILMRKQVFEKAGGYDESLPYLEDWDLWLRMGKITKMGNLPIVTTIVTAPEGDNSLSARFFLKQLALNRDLVRKYWKDYPNAWKAKLYHRFVALFFSVIRPNSTIHHTMQIVFRKVFLK